MNCSIALASLLLLSTIGCNQPQPARTMVLLDISASIYPEEVEREFGEVQKLVSTLHRGDQLIIIPITGNARNDTPGHLVRLVAPTRRVAFDGDLTAFEKDATLLLTAMKDWAIKAPTKRTDILGALVIAQKEAGDDLAKTKLVVMSDMLEDDGEVKFVSDPHLASVRQVRIYATQQAATLGLAEVWSDVSFVSLRSKEVAGLAPERLRAIDEFWTLTLGARSRSRHVAGAAPTSNDHASP